MARRTKEEADVTRQRILKCALNVFSRQGYASTRLEDVAVEAGVTRGAIYHHFGSKPELYTDMVVEYSKPISRIIERSVADGGTLIDVLRRQFIAMCAALEDDADLRAIQEISTYKTELTPELAEGIALKIENMEAHLNYIVQGFRDAQASGEISADIDPDDGARAYFAYLNGNMLLWLLDQKSFSIKASAPRLIDIFVRGLLPPP